MVPFTQTVAETAVHDRSGAQGPADGVRALRPSPGVEWLGASALLLNPDFYGTLAATQALGADGVEVLVAGSERLALARWSRYARRTLTCPALADSNRLLDWLCDLGDRRPGIVLYPTSDDTAFLYALRDDDLKARFRTYQSGLDPLLAVLDKKRLHDGARRVGLDVPRTWFPETDADVERIAREAPFPLLVKPRTQILSRDHTKGILVTRAEDLLSRYREFVRVARYAPVLLDRFPEAGQAMIQEFLSDAAEQIYVLAAFVDRSGSLFAARSGMKIFQRPRSLGIGLCFEGAPLDPAVARRARQLAVASGYFGLFQLEFVRTKGRYLLIDYNPRYYNQLAFDIARGLPLPHIVQAAACGRDDVVERLVRGAATPDASSDLVFCSEFGLEFMVAAQKLGGGISAAEASRWRTWRRDHAGTLVDPAARPGDPMPQIVDVVSQIYRCARHPRAFWRQIAQNRAPMRVTRRQQARLGLTEDRPR